MRRRSLIVFRMLYVVYRQSMQCDTSCMPLGMHNGGVARV